MKLHRSISSKYSILAAISFSESLILLLTRTLCSRCIGKWVPKKHSLPQIKSFEEGKCIGQIKNISCQFRIIAQIGSKFEWKHTVDLYTICMGSLHQHSNWRWSPPPQPIFSDDAGTQESLSFSYPPKSCDLVDIWKSATYVGDIYIYINMYIEPNIHLHFQLTKCGDFASPTQQQPTRDILKLHFPFLPFRLHDLIECGINKQNTFRSPPSQD